MQARVIKDWRTVYADPLTMHAGERLTLGRRDAEWPGWIWVTTTAHKSGWMPERLIEPHGPTGTALADYEARELDVRAGDTLTLHAEESGWHWAAASDGRAGWVPASHVAMLPLSRWERVRGEAETPASPRATTPLAP